MVTENDYNNNKLAPCGTDGRLFTTHKSWPSNTPICNTPVPWILRSGGRYLTWLRFCMKSSVGKYQSFLHFRFLPFDSWELQHNCTFCDNKICYLFVLDVALSPSQLTDIVVCLTSALLLLYTLPCGHFSRS